MHSNVIFREFVHINWSHCKPDNLIPILGSFLNELNIPTMDMVSTHEIINNPIEITFGQSTIQITNNNLILLLIQKYLTLQPARTTLQNKLNVIPTLHQLHLPKTLLRGYYRVDVPEFIKMEFCIFDKALVNFQADIFMRASRWAAEVYRKRCWFKLLMAINNNDVSDSREGKFLFVFSLHFSD